MLSSFAGDTTYTVRCGGDSVGVLSGNLNGAAASYCTTRLLSDSSGYAVVCGGDSVGVVLNGNAGVSGSAGAAGSFCNMELLSDSSGFKILCNGGDSVGVLLNGVSLPSGKYGSLCTKTKNADGSVTEVCGADSVVLYGSLCGTQSYDPRKKFCYDLELYDLCSDSAYNPMTQYCRRSLADTAVEALYVDSRDNRTYKTVTLGSQVWLAENLRYASATSYCYSDSLELCAQYGRLYTWEDAGEVCPDGWRLPEKADWDTLIVYVDAHDAGEGVAGSLKSVSGWNISAGGGSDRFGFIGIPAGYRNSIVDGFMRRDSSAYFWSNEPYSATDPFAYGVLLAGGNDDEIWSYYSQNAALSVRCIKQD